MVVSETFQGEKIRALYVAVAQLNSQSYYILDISHTGVYVHAFTDEKLRVDLFYIGTILCLI